MSRQDILDAIMICGSCLVALVAGTPNAFYDVAGAVQRDAGISQAAISLVLGAGTAGLQFTYFTGRFMDVYGPALTVMLGTLACSIGFAGTLLIGAGWISFLTGTFITSALLILFYFLVGVGSGTAFFGALGAALRLNNPISTGLVSVCMSLSLTLTIAGSQSLASKFRCDLHEDAGCWVRVYVPCSIVVLISMLVGSFLMLASTTGRGSFLSDIWDEAKLASAREKLESQGAILPSVFEDIASEVEWASVASSRRSLLTQIIDNVVYPDELFGQNIPSNASQRDGWSVVRAPSKLNDRIRINADHRADGNEGRQVGGSVLDVSDEEDLSEQHDIVGDLLNLGVQNDRSPLLTTRSEAAHAVKLGAQLPLGGFSRWKPGGVQQALVHPKQGTPEAPISQPHQPSDLDAQPVEASQLRAPDRDFEEHHFLVATGYDADEEYIEKVRAENVSVRRSRLREPQRMSLTRQLRTQTATTVLDDLLTFDTIPAIGTLDENEYTTWLVGVRPYPRRRASVAHKVHDLSSAQNAQDLRSPEPPLGFELPGDEYADARTIRRRDNSITSRPSNRFAVVSTPSESTSQPSASSVSRVEPGIFRILLFANMVGVGVGLFAVTSISQLWREFNAPVERLQNESTRISLSPPWEGRIGMFISATTAMGNILSPLFADSLARHLKWRHEVPVSLAERKAKIYILCALTIVSSIIFISLFGISYLPWWFPEDQVWKSPRFTRQYVFAALLSAAGFGLGGYFVMTPVITADIYGLDKFGAKLADIQLGTAFAVLSVPLIRYLAVAIFSSFTGCFVLCAVLLLTAALLLGRLSNHIQCT